MTSPIFKLYWVFTFMRYYSSWTTLSIHIFGSKGFVFLQLRVLEFPNFCVTWHLVGSQESSYVTVGYKRYPFFRFCYLLNIPCHRINITWIFMSSSSHEFMFLWQTSKTDVSVSFRLPCLCPSKGQQHGTSIPRGGYFRNFWVGMCRWDPGTLNLY